MSFLGKAQPILRQAAIIKPAPRLFSTAVVYQKSATETVKDGLKAVDRTVSDTVVAGIDKGVEVKDKAADIAGINAKKAQGEVQEKLGEAQGKYAEVKGEAKGKAQEVSSKAQS